MSTPTYYKKLRNRYLPQKVKAIFILESPPSSGKYFYNERGRVTEPLFAAMMRLLKYQPAAKRDGLQRFQEVGYLLVDAIYRPVDKIADRLANELILKNCKNLIHDLKDVGQARRAPVILVKDNICRLLEPELVRQRFHVLNGGRRIPFPSHGWQQKFERTVAPLLRSL